MWLQNKIKRKIHEPAALPGFLLIGAAACGKSALLRNSGLHFSLLDNNNFSGINNCAWWFSEAAVVLDTAGGYMDPKKREDEWPAFLRILKKNRPRLPINGIIAVVSLAGLSAKDTEKLNWQIKIIHIGISEIYKQLGFIVPVTLAFTKADLIIGFKEFFFGLKAAEREQVWGINFEKNYVEQLDALYAKLTQLRLQQMAVGHDLKYKLAIFDFPEQFKSRLDVVKKFIKLLQQNNLYQVVPYIIGAYFTSATQEGKNSHAYFIKDLFSKVIFQNINLAVKTKERIRIEKRLKSAGVVVCAAVLLAVFMLYRADFRSNVLLLNQGESIARKLSHLRGNERLKPYYQFYDLLLNYKKKIPWRYRLGLYRGNREVAPLEEMLSSTLWNKFLQPMGKILTQKLIEYSENWTTASTKDRERLRGGYCTALTAYLMLSSSRSLTAGCMRMAYRDLAREVFSIYWQNGDVSNELIDFYLQHPSPWRADKQLVNLARNQLYSPDPAHNLYAQIVYILNGKLLQITLYDLLDGTDSNLLVSNHKLSGIYAINAWRKYVKPEINTVVKINQNGDWVMNVSSLGNIDERLKKIYFTSRKQAWLKFLASIKVRRFNSLIDANRQTGILAGAVSPLKQLLLKISANLNINKHDKYLLVKTSFMGKQSYFAELLRIRDDLKNLSADSNGKAALDYAAHILSASGSNTELYQAMIAANTLANRFDDKKTGAAIQQLLLQPIRETWRAILQAATTGLENEWKNRVFNSYQQNIANKFPFSRDATSDADISDVSDFFRVRTGVLWKFVNTSLKPFLFFNGSKWQEQQWLGIGAGFSGQMLTVLNMAKIITYGLFNKEKFNYQIYPIPTVGLSQIVFSFGGEKYSYNNGPQQWQNFEWSPNVDQDTFISAITANGKNSGRLLFPGSWGAFHLFAKGRITAERDNIYRITWKMKIGSHIYPISFLMRANRSNNIFAEILLNKFILPKQIFSPLP